MKSDRLLSILLLLQARGRVTATDLAARLEVSTRTIYRDIEALSAAGVPVYAERGRNGGVALLPGFRTNVTGLTADEARALFVLATRSAHADLGLEAALGSALRKLLAAVPEPHRHGAAIAGERILVDPSRWMRGPAETGHLGLLQRAVFADLRVRLRYRHGGETESHDYTVDPYGLVAKAGIWYLVADLAAEPRLFRVDRMQSASIVDEPVRRRAVQLAEVWEALRRQVEERPADLRVVARVRGERLDTFRRVFATNLVRTEDGADWARVELSFRGVGGARPMLAFGADVVVVSPEEVREDLSRTAVAALAVHRVQDQPGS